MAMSGFMVLLKSVRNTEGGADPAIGVGGVTIDVERQEAGERDETQGVGVEMQVGRDAGVVAMKARAETAERRAGALFRELGDTKQRVGVLERELGETKSRAETAEARVGVLERELGETKRSLAEAESRVEEGGGAC